MVRAFEKLAAVGGAGGDFEGDDVALFGSQSEVFGGLKRGEMDLGLIEELDRDANCGRHGGGGMLGELSRGEVGAIAMLEIYRCAGRSGR